MDLKYSLADKNVRETVSDYDIALAYVVKGDYTEEDLKKLADYLLNLAKKEPGSKTFEHPEKVQLYIYASENDIERDERYLGFGGEYIVEGFARTTTDFQDWEPNEVRIMPSPKHQPDVFYRDRAFVRILGHDYQGALDDCNKLFELVPEADMPYGWRGLAKFHLKDYDGAIDDFTMHIKRNPDTIESFTYRGLSKGMLGDWNNSLTDCQHALNLNASEVESSEARFCVGLSKIQLGNTHEGCADLSTVDNSLLTEYILTELNQAMIENCSNGNISQTREMDEKEVTHDSASGSDEKQQPKDGSTIIEENQKTNGEITSTIKRPKIKSEPNITKSTKQQADFASGINQEDHNQEFEREVKRYMEGLSNPDPLVPDFEKNTCKPRNMPKALEEACKRLGYWNQ